MRRGCCRRWRYAMTLMIDARARRRLAAASAPRSIGAALSLISSPAIKSALNARQHAKFLAGHSPRNVPEKYRKITRQHRSFSALTAVRFPPAGRTSSCLVARRRYGIRKQIKKREGGVSLESDRAEMMSALSRYSAAMPISPVELPRLSCFDITPLRHSSQCATTPRFPLRYRSVTAPPPISPQRQYHTVF